MICSKMVKHFLLQMASLQAQPYNFPSIVSVRVGYQLLRSFPETAKALMHLVRSIGEWKAGSVTWMLVDVAVHGDWVWCVFFGCPSGKRKDRKHMAVSSLVPQKRPTVRGWSFNPHHFKYRWYNMGMWRLSDCQANSGRDLDRAFRSVSKLINSHESLVTNAYTNSPTSPVSSFVSSMVGWSVGVSHLQCAFCRGCHGWRVRSSKSIACRSCTIMVHAIMWNIIRQKDDSMGGGKLDILNIARVKERGCERAMS